MSLTTLDTVPALVVVDLQNGLRQAVTHPHDLESVITATASLAAAFRAHGLPVVLVRVSLDGAGFSPGRTERGPRNLTAPPGWDAIVDELAGYPDDVVVTKRTVGAFVGTDLDLHLRRRGVSQVVLTGVATSAGVEGTARSAHDHGYHVVVVTDAVGDPDEDSHHHSVATIFPKIGETATVADVLAMLATTHGQPAR